MTLADYLNKKYILEEISSLTVLDCSNQRITSLEGIEGYTSLEVLFCHNNQLTSLEGLEGCPSLTYLNCRNNQLTSLKELERCTSLTYLRCRKNPTSFRSLYRSLKDLNIKEVNGISYEKYINDLKIEALKETLNLIK